ncbi:Trk system potassium transporter TrkA [Qingrenia yutianensis]|uniref:Trk system potassium uptake protein TrkA n=1 Tax=Qingrenia yutianensis TaxID=2763676 RepID=A0A926F6D4_9FIRM|nr:Trk system potassium transporter TrkA [Qingrenia yutianensis]MBC8596613.1 Trk system potassium transporter TrkA [Qingrenia yutianensis]
MNIIVLGCGKAGQKIAELLNEENGHNITLIDRRYDVVNDIINHFDIMGVVGDGADVDVLKEAGIETADLLIAVTGSDELNLLASLMAKKLGNCRSIARVRRPEYHKVVNLMKDDLGLAMAINPERAAASEIARILRFPTAIQIDTFAKGRVEILKFKVPEQSPLDGMKVMDIVAKLNCDVLVCGVERASEVFIPGGNFELKSGDLISIVSSIQEGTQFFKKIGIKTNRVKDTLIIGGGGTAYYLAYLLIETGINVKIVEQNPNRCDELLKLLPKATVICGDGTDNRLLIEEGLESAESVVSLTNIDEENVLLSLYAKTKTNGKVVTKINRIAYDRVINSLDLGTTIYPKNITAEYIVRFVRAKKNSLGSQIETMHFILDNKAEALEFRIKDGSPISGISIDSLKLKDNLLIACINRGGKIIIPRGKDVIMPGDTVIVVTLKSGFKDVSDILK